MQKHTLLIVQCLLLLVGADQPAWTISLYNPNTQECFSMAEGSCQVCAGSSFRVACNLDDPVETGYTQCSMIEYQLDSDCDENASSIASPISDFTVMLSPENDKDICKYLASVSLIDQCTFGGLPNSRNAWLIAILAAVGTLASVIFVAIVGFAFYKKSTRYDALESELPDQEHLLA